MKQLIKTVFCILLCGCLCVALCGCNALDDLRTRQIYRIDDEYLELDGDKYRKMPAADNIWFEADPAFYHITQPDVPVLVAAIIGGMGEYDPERDLLQDEDGNYYCPADWYEEYQNLIVNHVEDKFFVAGYEFNEETGLYEDTEYFLTENDMQVLEYALEQGVALSNTEALSVLGNYDLSCEICCCDRKKVAYELRYVAYYVQEVSSYYVYNEHSQQMYRMEDRAKQLCKRLIELNNGSAPEIQP